MNKKIPIVIICVLVVFCGILLLVLQDKNEDKNSSLNELNNKKTYYLVIGNDSVWSYHDKWSKASNTDIDGNKLEVYIEKKYIGLKTLKYGTVWNIFSGNEYEFYDGSMLAFSTDFGKVINFTISNIDNDNLQEINKILKSNFHDYSFSVNEKISVDLNSDGRLDTIVSVSNLDIEGQDLYFNLVYTKINDKINILINESIQIEDYYNAPIYNMNYVLNILNTNYIIFRKGYFSNVNKSGNIMYELIDGKYELVIED